MPKKAGGRYGTRRQGRTFNPAFRPGATNSEISRQVNRDYRRQQDRWGTSGGGGSASGGGSEDQGGRIQDLLHSELRDVVDDPGAVDDHDVRYLNLSGLNGLQSFIDFALGAPPAHTEGRLFYDNVNKAMAFYIDESAVTLQIGQEQWMRTKNDSGVDIADGDLVRISGATAGLPNIILAKADSSTTTDQLIGMATHDIDDGTIGIVTTFGTVRAIDTSACGGGNVLYLSASTAGGFTDTQPVYPNYVMRIGLCQISDGSDGEVHINIVGRKEDILENGWNGCFLEPLKFTITESGGTVTGNLQQDATGDLTMYFSDGMTVLDCTPVCTIDLTAYVGIDTLPQDVYIYIPFSTKTLTASTAGFPTEQHIRVADIGLQSATTTGTKGALVNRNHNNHIAGTNGQGHINHQSDWIRLQHASWISGTEGSATIVGASSPDDVYVAATAGWISQLHPQQFPALDTQVSDDVNIVNHNTTPLLSVQNLNGQLTDASGGTLSNRSFSFVLWGVINRTGETSHLMLNLPTGSYNSSGAAESDALGYSVYDIPNLYKGKGFLIARFNFSHSPGGGGTWTLDSTDDLRGFFPNSTAGSSGGGSGVTTWLGLTDTPVSFAGNALDVVRVAAGETALEFFTPPWLTSPLTTTGDMLVYEGGDSRFPVGTDGQIIEARAASSPGINWIDDWMFQQTWNIINQYEALTGAGAATTHSLDVSSAFSDVGAIGNTTTLSAVSSYNFSTHYVNDNYASFQIPYSWADPDLLAASHLALYDCFRRETGFVEIKVRCKISGGIDVANVLDTCRIGYSDEDNASNKQSTTFTPTTSWAEYTHITSSTDAYGNSLTWFVEFPQKLTQASEIVDEPNFTIDVDYVRVSHKRV